MMTNLQQVRNLSKLASWVAIAGLGVFTLPVIAQTTPTQPNPVTPNNPTTTPPINPTQNPRPGTNQTSLSAIDQNFITQAAEDGLLEVQLGQLATQRASSDAVRQYGQRMVQAHTQVNNQLRELATQNNVSLPQNIGDRDALIVTRFSNLSGPNFDQAYLRQMVNSHIRAVNLFERQAQQGNNPELRTFANRNLPTLREHLQRARQLESQAPNQNQPQNQPQNPNLVEPINPQTPTQPIDSNQVPTDPVTPNR